MTTDRGYLIAVLLGLAAAVLVGWQLESSESTACFRASVEISVGGSDEVLAGCTTKPFDAVREHIADQREAAASGTSVPEEPEEVKAKSVLIVWMALFAATAGFAAIFAVQAVAIIRGLRPRWTGGLIARSVGAATLVAIPFVVFRLVPVDLSPYNDLHKPPLLWIPPLVGLLMLPAITGLVVIWHTLSLRADLGLDDVARLGSQMRQLVGMLGAVLALSVLTTAARWQAIATLPGGEALPSILILLWGSVFALVLGALYVPVHQRWAARTAALISDEVRRQLPDDPSLRGTAGFRAPELQLTKELYATLGVGGPLKSLQGSVAVLAPVIAAAISSLFS